MTDFQVFKSKEHLLEDAPKLIKRIGAFWNWDTKLVLRYEPYQAPRSRSQLNLYREWLRRLADHFSVKGNQFSDDDMHDLMRHQFLGYEDKVVGSTEIRSQLKSTANGKIGKSEMSQYMTKVDAWAADLGCYLPHPEDNDYTKYKRAST